MPDDPDALLDALDHPHRDAIDLLRATIRDADPRVRERVKWNAPSFATSEHFATFHLRARRGVQVVLHLGARPRADAAVRDAVDDPTSMLEWRGPDRATVAFADAADVVARRAAFASVVRRWIACVG